MLDHVWSLHELEVGQSWELIQLRFKTSESAVDQHLESPTLTVTNGSSSTTGLYVSHMWYTLQCVLDQQVPRSLLTWHFSMSVIDTWYPHCTVYLISHMVCSYFILYLISMATPHWSPNFSHYYTLIFTYLEPSDVVLHSQVQWPTVKLHSVLVLLTMRLLPLLQISPWSQDKFWAPIIHPTGGACTVLRHFLHSFMCYNYCCKSGQSGGSKS